MLLEYHLGNFYITVKNLNASTDPSARRVIHASTCGSSMSPLRLCGSISVLWNRRLGEHSNLDDCAHWRHLALVRT